MGVVPRLGPRDGASTVAVTLLRQRGPVSLAVMRRAAPQKKSSSAPDNEGETSGSCGMRPEIGSGIRSGGDGERSTGVGGSFSGASEDGCGRFRLMAGDLILLILTSPP